MELKERSCSNTIKEPLNNEQIAAYKLQLKTKWEIPINEKLKKVFRFKSFERAVAFVQEIALLAQKENHHPDICIHFDEVVIELTSHDLGGISLNDFIMAAKIEDL